MIVIELKGGLGNQMFQYACAKSFSLKHKQPLFIDTSFLDENQIEKADFTPRIYELGIFGLEEPIADKQLVRSFKQSSVTKKLKYRFKLRYKKVYAEDEGRDAEQLNNISPPVLLTGFWQSEQYFKNCGGLIRDVFKFKLCPNELDEVLKEIENINAVSVHFRRGDYVTNPIAQKVLGALDIDYYHHALKKIESKVESPFYYVFSDDPKWVAANFPAGYNYKIFRSDSPAKNWHDMLVMSKCKHNIIANSSFSWWSAWLNSNPDKIVIAPDKWFAEDTLKT